VYINSTKLIIEEKNNNIDNNRSLGLGMASSLGRIGGGITPFIAISVFGIPEIGPTISLCIYSFVALLLAVFTYYIPRETLGMLSQYKTQYKTQFSLFFFKQTLFYSHK
jgi:hypothetical protein